MVEVGVLSEVLLNVVVARHSFEQLIAICVAMFGAFETQRGEPSRGGVHPLPNSFLIVHPADCFSVRCLITDSDFCQSSWVNAGYIPE